MNPKIAIKVLTKVRSQIRKGWWTHICHALEDLGDEYIDKPNWMEICQVCDELQKLIISRVGVKPWYGLEGWLRTKGIPSEDLGEKNMRAYRIRFINHLIEEFKEQL